MNHIEYMRRLGRKGGSKRAHHPDRKAMARKAAAARWKDHAKRISNNDATRLASYPNNSPSEKEA